jgi:hypothetical protein
MVDPRRLKLLFATAFLLLVQSLATNAAEFTCVGEYSRYGSPPVAEVIASKLWPSGYRPLPTSCESILLQGSLENGDFERFRAFYRQHHRAVRNLYLISSGGNVEEALQIGRLVRRYLISVWAPSRSPMDNSFGLWTSTPSLETCRGPTCICASACGLIWLGAVQRFGEIGLHRPRITDPQFRALSANDASAVYKRALQEISRYLDDMEAPRALVDTMVATSFAEIRWVDASADDDQLENPPSFIEWVDASCGPLTSLERKTLTELGARKGFAKVRPGTTAVLTQQEELLLKIISAKDFARSRCKTTLVSAHRDALPSP